MNNSNLAIRHLSNIQRRIVEYKEGALLVNAGPGSGKTFVLTERIRKLLDNNDGNFRILALTFTNKAASEMKERLSNIENISEKATIGTLHSFCIEVLSNRGKNIGIDGPPNIFESYESRKQVLIEAILSDPNLKYELNHKYLNIDNRINEWLNKISEFKSKLIVPELVDNNIYKKVYQAYNEGLKLSNAIDYDDLLLLTYQLFISHPKIANFYRRLYKYICIDEAQDLNEAQYQLLRALCGENYKNVMLVGDSKQSIYVWNGASPKYMEQFKKDFKAEQIDLTENYRSSRAVIESAQKLIPEYRVEGVIPIEGNINYIEGSDEQEEAVLVLDYIQGLLENGHKDIEGDITLDRCAVLGRTRYVLNAIEKEIQNRKLSYYKKLSSQNETESELFEDFKLVLKLISNPKDRLHYSMLMKRWSIEFDPEELINNKNELIHILNQKCLACNKQVFSDIIQAVETKEGDFDILPALELLGDYANKLNNDEERELTMRDIDLWKKSWNKFIRNSSSNYRTLSAFLGQFALGSIQEVNREGLGLLTVHSSKGLEFDVVVIMGLTEGTFPHYKATGESLEEEKRNMFVAVTRSRRLLCLSYPRTKLMPWGEFKMQKSSRFLNIIRNE